MKVNLNAKIAKFLIKKVKKICKKRLKKMIIDIIIKISNFNITIIINVKIKLNKLQIFEKILWWNNKIKYKKSNNKIYLILKFKKQILKIMNHQITKN